jgi:FKBP-type peptidyl-prolyl cis-trans isomerase
MNEGDQITAVFPSSLVFGDKGDAVFQIPPFTPVVYEIELLRVVGK